jgi:hypothetical protein
MINIQQKNDVIIGMAIQNIDSQLKYETTKVLNPDILALGTSRVMQFRKEFFNDEVLFYNAGGAVSNLGQFINFIDTLDKKPKFIIIGLDQYFFNENWSKSNQDLTTYKYKYNPIKIIANFYRFILTNRSEINQAYKYDENIGLTAKVYGDGYRKDGSYFYNRIINFPESEYSKKFIYPFKDTIRRIDAGNSRFDYGGDIYKKSIEQIIELLDRCKNEHIQVIAFIPPFAPYVNIKLEENGNYNYIKKIYPTLLPIFAEYGHEIYDFTDSSNISDDSMYIDGFHGNENTYHNILLEMKKRNSVLKEYVK